MIQTTPFRYLLRYSSRAKRLRIQVTPGEVRVIAPSGVSMPVIDKFVRSREEWVKEKLFLFASSAHNSPSSSYTNGAEIYFLGETVVLRVVNLLSGTRETELHDEVLFLYPAGEQDEKSYLKSEVSRWLDSRLSDFVKETAEMYLPCGYAPARIRLGNAKTRWGSCSLRGVIMINRKLVHAPPAVVEYVLVHELVHLRHRNHSKVFWAAVERLLGDVKPQKKWLRIQGAHLL